ncbi:hypothetical protein D3C85_1747890 [compost metagenome]
MRHAVHLALTMIAFAGCLLLIGCAPTPFVLGPEVSPPPGCIDLRARGGSC